MRTKSRSPKIRGREYISDLKPFLGDEWPVVVLAVQKLIPSRGEDDWLAPSSRKATLKWLAEIEVHSIVVGCNAAGWAYYQGNKHGIPRIDLHWSVLENYSERHTAHKWTVTWHEIAHMLSYKVSGESGHGEHWRKTFGLLLDAPIQRCHDLPTPLPYKDQVKRAAYLNKKKKETKALRNGKLPCKLRLPLGVMQDLEYSESGSWEDHQNGMGDGGPHVYPILTRHKTVLEIKTVEEAELVHESVRYSTFGIYQPAWRARLELKTRILVRDNS